MVFDGQHWDHVTTENSCKQQCQQQSFTGFIKAVVFLQVLAIPGNPDCLHSSALGILKANGLPSALNESQFPCF